MSEAVLGSTLSDHRNCSEGRLRNLLAAWSACLGELFSWRKMLKDVTVSTTRVSGLGRIFRVLGADHPRQQGRRELSRVRKGRPRIGSLRLWCPE